MMFVVSGGRRTGKTSFLIWKSAFTGIPIMARSRQQKEFIECQAKRMGVKIPKPVIFSINNHHCRDGYKIRSVFIDDADHWIRQVVAAHMGCEVEGMTGEFALGELRPSIYKIDETDNVFSVADEGQWTLARAAMYGEFVQKEGGKEYENL